MRQMAYKRRSRRTVAVAVALNMALMVTAVRLLLACLFVLTHGATWWL